jgi:hypothetical protein
MSAEYRFLRFEIVGIATIAFLLIGIFPMLDSTFLSSLLARMDASLAIVAGLFLLSLPLGYVEHQLVVNAYRSPGSKRAVFEVLEDMVVEIEESYKKNEKTAKQCFFQELDSVRKNSFLTILLDFCIYSNTARVNSSVFSRLSDRWSHFYARRAVGKYAPMFSIVLWIILLILGLLVSWPLSFQLQNFVLAGLWWITVFWLIGGKIDSYSKKIWFEISFLETSIVLANRDKILNEISPVVISMIEHPEYVEKGESYAHVLYRF